MGQSLEFWQVQLVIMPLKKEIKSSQKNKQINKVKMLGTIQNKIASFILKLGLTKHIHKKKWKITEK